MFEFIYLHQTINIFFEIQKLITNRIQCVSTLDWCEL